MTDRLTGLLNKNQKKIIAFVMLVMTIAGFAVTGGYGVPLDEAIEMSILTSNVKEYAMHIPGALGDKLENKFSYVIPISQSEEKDHGIAAYYGYVPLHVLADDARAQSAIWHAYTFLIFMAGVFAMYGIVRELSGSSWQALFAALMLYLSPRMFAEGHYNNKDMVVMSFVLLTIYFGIKMIRAKKYTFAVLFAAAAAVATNTKIVGAWFFGIIGIAYLVYLIAGKELKKHNVLVGITAIIAFFAGYVLLTPAMWNNPVEFIRYLLVYAQDFDRWDNNILFEGNIYRYSVNPPPKYYLLKMIFITTPVYILVLNAAGMVLTIVNLVKSRLRDRKALAMAVNLLLWVFPLTFAVISGTRVYNGWRHFYFVYGPMVITASYAVYCAAKALAVSAKKYVKEGLTAAACLIVMISSIGLVVSHPHQYAYFNIFAGSDAENNYETDYWMVSTKAALKELYEKKYDGKNAIKIASIGRMNVNAMGKALRAMAEEMAGAFKTCDMSEAEYLFVNPYGLVLDTSVNFEVENKEKEVSVKSYGNEIAAIYKIGNGD